LLHDIQHCQAGGGLARLHYAASVDQVGLPGFYEKGTYMKKILLGAALLAAASGVQAAGVGLKLGTTGVWRAMWRFPYHADDVCPCAVMLQRL
jgi:hypothetical protein